MTKSLWALSRTTLGAQVSPGLAHEPTWGSTAEPLQGVQLTPSDDVAAWMLIVSLGTAKFCVAKA